MKPHTFTFTVYALWLITIIAMVIAIWSLIQPAHPAEMNICRPYATKVTQILIRFAWYRAYTSCINADEAPVAPRLTSDWNAALCVVLPGCHFTPPGDAPAIEVPSEEDLTPEMKVDTDPLNLKELEKKCAKKHPRGWDQKTQTVSKLVNRKWVRVRCELLP